MADNEIENDPILEKHFAEAGIAPDANDDTNGGDDNETDTENGDEGEQEQATTPAAAEGSDASGDDSGSGDDDGSGKQGKEKEGQGADPANEQLKPGDLRAEDGTIVRGGKERRWYENMQLERQRHDHTKKSLNELQTQVEKYKTQVQSYEQAAQVMGGANPQEVASALRLFKDLKQNPSGTVQTLLTELKAAGHNVNIDGAGIDISAISAMIDQRLGKPAAAEQQQVDPVQEAQMFYTKFPDALPHDAVLAEFVRRYPNISNEEAYWQLRQEVINQGYDWSKPLKPQYEARNQQQQQGKQQRQAPMPNGRVASAPVVVREEYSARGGETTDDIVRAAMRESGMLKT